MNARLHTLLIKGTRRCWIGPCRTGVHIDWDPMICSKHKIIVVIVLNLWLKKKMRQVTVMTIETQKNSGREG